MMGYPAIEGKDGSVFLEDAIDHIKELNALGYHAIK